MKGGPHLVIGAAAGMGLAGGVFTDAGGVSTEALLVVAGAALGGLAPDVDHEASMGSRWLGMASTLLSLGVGVVAAGGAAQVLGAGLVVAAAVGVCVGLATAAVLTWLMPWRHVAHRGPLHSLLLAVVVGMIGVGLFGVTPLGLAFGAGWLSHLLADAPTFAGQPFFWPLEAPVHRHWMAYRQRDRRDEGRWRECTMWHLTPKPLRWRSGLGLVEWPIAIACVGLAWIGPSR